ncbi:MAG: methionine ABC transporter ATP-binding protein [Deltaproteobacteria bacterium]|jgi:D-methionine transport system ATP-binding protein|nr:methionine ABC transporter ATP-binding protein [Deltaproteobacteria bacterium]
MIQVNGLCKKFGAHFVLRDITLRVEKGEIFGIVGHSGAGKSTLLRCLNGLETYSGGSVRVMGREVGSLGQKEMLNLRRRMGMIFQTFNLMERRNVFENVAFPLEVWRVPKERARERVEDLLKLVGLEGKSSVRPGNLSGGQKQRVGIARALALRPDILLCDEPTSALDPHTTASILDLLQDINERFSLTIVLVTHQMEVVKRMCGRTLLLDGGLPQGTGETSSLFLAPPEHLRRLIQEEYALLSGGVNIRLVFGSPVPDASPGAAAGPLRANSGKAPGSSSGIISAMARDLDLDFSIVGGRLERYGNDILGFLIINVEAEEAGSVLEYLRVRNVSRQIVERPAPGGGADA